MTNHADSVYSNALPERKRHWTVTPRGQMVIVQCPPFGSDPIPEEAGLPTQHCFVSSYTWCHRHQEISLEECGFPPWMTDTLKPKIHISEW